MILEFEFEFEDFMITIRLTDLRLQALCKLEEYRLFCCRQDHSQKMADQLVSCDESSAYQAARQGGGM